MPRATSPLAKTDQRPWKIVVLHDSRSACHRAVSTLGKLLPPHARESGVRSSWQFADFEDPARCEELFREIAGADLIVVAPAADAPVPMEMVERLGELLAGRKDRVPSVITVCDPAVEAQEANHLSAALLRRVAVAAGMMAGAQAHAPVFTLTR